jgi:hypothetical protein
MFLRERAQHAYYEFNFAPSLQWAAYRFRGYKSGMLALEISAPRIEIRQGAGHSNCRALTNGNSVARAA